jgi:hypothetical protein
MNYPFWDVNIGYGILMAVIAVVHVFVSHFAIGGGLYLVIAERRARKNNDIQWLDYLHRLSRFFVLLTVVFGALTGVGIWFIIGLLNPAATEVLIHNFVWVFATEWTSFIIEICAAILYFYGWEKIPARDHLRIGWIYLVSSWMSLLVVNGIITFMLTPGEWLKTGNLWDGIFNPTFWPSLLMRTGICIMLAGLYSMAVISRYKPSDFKISAVRYNAVWGILGLSLALPSLCWYWNAIPSSITEKAVQMMVTPISSIELSYWFAGAIGVLLVIYGLIFPKRQQFEIAVIVLVFGLVWFGSFEWFRESIRKPYVIYGYMYGNGIELSKKDLYKKEGYLKHIDVVPVILSMDTNRLSLPLTVLMKDSSPGLFRACMLSGVICRRFWAMQMKFRNWRNTFTEKLIHVILVKYITLRELNWVKRYLIYDAASAMYLAGTMIIQGPCWELPKKITATSSMTPVNWLMKCLRLQGTRRRGRLCLNI